MQSKPKFANSIGIFPLNRLEALSAASAASRARIEELISLAKDGLPQTYRKGGFVHTVHMAHGRSGPAIRPEGENLRYTTNVALGLRYVDEETQRQILNGSSAAYIERRTVAWAES